MNISTYMLNLDHTFLGPMYLLLCAMGLWAFAPVGVYLAFFCFVVLCNNIIVVFAVLLSRRLAIASDYNSNCLYFISTEYQRRITACQYRLFVYEFLLPRCVLGGVILNVRLTNFTFVTYCRCVCVKSV